jgi:hypothetical protein
MSYTNIPAEEVEKRSLEISEREAGDQRDFLR